MSGSQTLLKHSDTTHLTSPSFAQDKFSGIDPDQDAEPIIRLIECKINFALGLNQIPLMQSMVSAYSERKPYSPRYYEDQQSNGMGALLEML